MYPLRGAALTLLVWSLCVGSAIAAYQGFDIFVPQGTRTTSYVSRLVAAMPWAAFKAMCALVGGHMLSIKTWASQRDRGVSTVARDFSTSTTALTADLNDLEERWTKRGVLGWAARQTVFLLVHSGAILYDFTAGPLVDTFGGHIVDFLYACLLSAVVLHVQGEITLKRRKTYAAACFHGNAILLTVTLGFAYFDDAHQVIVNALASQVLRALLHAQLIEFKITVICCFVEMKRVSTWTYNIDKHLHRFQILTGVIVPESQVNDADDSEGIAAPASPAAAQNLAVGDRVTMGGAPGRIEALPDRGWWKLRIDGEKTVRSVRRNKFESASSSPAIGDNAHRRITFSTGRHSPLGRLATLGRVGEDKARAIVWHSDQAKKDVAHAISLKGSLPRWLQPDTFTETGLLSALNTKYAKCERRAALLLREVPQTDLVVREGGRLVLAFRLRAPRVDLELAPLLIVDDVPNDIPWSLDGGLGHRDAAKFLAHYCCLRTTPMFLLLALVHAIREEYDSALPSCIDEGRWTLEDFRFRERAVEDLPDFVRRLRAFIDTEWPALIVGVPYEVATFQKSAVDGRYALVAGSLASRRGSTDVELPAFPVQVTLYDAYSAYAASSVPAAERALNIEAFRKHLVMHSDTDLINGAREHFA